MKAKDAAQDLDNEVDADALRQATADKMAKAVQSYFKTSIMSIIDGGVPIPQDGGAGLKNTMTAKINTI